MPGNNQWGWGRAYRYGSVFFKKKRNDIVLR
jgi:hypothetical protein